MAEWLKAHAWKACIRETVSWVRIPLSPPYHYKIPILRPPFPPEQMERLVQSAIKPQVRVLLVVGDPNASDPSHTSAAIVDRIRKVGSLWHLVTSYPTSFEIELQSNGDDALRRYRECGPYDMVLTGYWISGMVGSDLALAIRRENPAQPIAVITEESSSAVRRSIQRKLGTIPVLTLENFWDAMRGINRSGEFEGEGQRFIGAVEAAIKAKQERKKHSRTKA
jgi:CheY-like chemotaxis protein